MVSPDTNAIGDGSFGYAWRLPLFVPELAKRVSAAAWAACHISERGPPRLGRLLGACVSRRITSNLESFVVRHVVTQHPMGLSFLRVGDAGNGEDILPEATEWPPSPASETRTPLE